MREISLTEPLQKRYVLHPFRYCRARGRIKSLKAVMWSESATCNYIWPARCGKTAARLVLEEAKRNPKSPFRTNATFIELDATTARFDERGIADPLIRLSA